MPAPVRRSLLSYSLDRPGGDACRRQDYPSRTIKILVSTAPGGLIDILPRILGQKVTETTGQPVIVENRPGGNGAVAGAEAAKSPPDGYTLMMGFHGVNAMLPHMTSKLAFRSDQGLRADRPHHDGAEHPGGPSGGARRNRSRS